MFRFEEAPTPGCLLFEGDCDVQILLLTYLLAHLTEMVIYDEISVMDLLSKQSEP